MYGGGGGGGGRVGFQRHWEIENNSKTGLKELTYLLMLNGCLF